MPFSFKKKPVFFGIILIIFTTILLYYSKNELKKTWNKEKESYLEEKKFSNLTFHDGLNFKVLGKIHRDNNYQRLPSRFKNDLRTEVWNLSQQSAGISIHFITNASTLGVLWDLEALESTPFMSKIGQNGVDLYYLENSEWTYVATGIPSSIRNQSLFLENMDASYKEFILNLPLYSKVNHLAIGINSDAKMDTGSKNFIVQDKPIVFYGTSLTQGGSASRPGLAYTSQISRKLNREVINLGFDGNGKFESEIGELLCEIDASVMIIDCTPNSSPDLIKERALPFISQLRECKPHIPIFLVESIIRNYTTLNTGNQNDRNSLQFNLAQNQELNIAYQKAIELGLSNIHYISADQLIDTKSESTVDGIHLSDIGHTEFAEALSFILKKHL